MERRIEDLIIEDMINLTNHNGMGDGDKYTQQTPLQLSLIDILKMTRENDTKAKAALPYQLQTVVDRLMKQADDIISVRADFVDAYNNPMIKDNDDAKQMIQHSVGKLKEIEKLYTQVFLYLDKMQ